MADAFIFEAVIYGLYKLPMVRTDHARVLLTDGQVLNIEGIYGLCLRPSGQGVQRVCQAEAPRSGGSL